MSLLSNPFDPAREAALVTGAGNGIGRATGQALVGEGVRTGEPKTLQKEKCFQLGSLVKNSASNEASGVILAPRILAVHDTLRSSMPDLATWLIANGKVSSKVRAAPEIPALVR